jgi:hypothetical protein
MTRFWPAVDPAQRDYERLRAAVLPAGRLPADLAAARFARGGLAGLISWPDREPVFTARLIGATRAAWTPYADPRPAALAACYRLLLVADQACPDPIPAVRQGPAGWTSKEMRCV